MTGKLKIILLSTFLTFVLMLSYESAKELIFEGGLTPWQSHWITIAFTTAVSLVVVLLAVNRLLLLERQDIAIRLKEEKLKSIRQVMRVVHHHVNNLANSLNMVALEIERDGCVSGATLDALRRAIEETAGEMKLLGDITNPDDAGMFELNS